MSWDDRFEHKQLGAALVNAVGIAASDSEDGGRQAAIAGGQPKSVCGMDVRTS